MNIDFVNECGINHVLVGSSARCKYFPIAKEDIEKNLIFAEEFVFGQKFQIIPIFSFEVIRQEYIILWKDDHIDNHENSRYIKSLLQQGINVYPAKNNEEAIEILKKKKRNKIKFVTNCGPDLLGKQLIETIRNEFHYNFICLVFTSTFRHLDWITKMENVIMTINPDKFKEFISLEMTRENVLNYVNELEKMCYTKFNINENDILNFPDFIDDIDDVLNNPQKLKHPQHSQSNDSQQPKSDDSQQPKLNDSQKPKLNDSQQPKSDDSQQPKLNDSQQPKSDDSQQPKLNNSQKPKLNDSQKPKINDSQQPKSDDSQQSQSNGSKKVKKNKLKKQNKTNSKKTNLQQAQSENSPQMQTNKSQQSQSNDSQQRQLNITFTNSHEQVVLELSQRDDNNIEQSHRQNCKCLIF